MSRHKTLIFALITIILAILFGAFGAHALKPFLTRELLSSYDTAVFYQLVHGIALMALTLGKFPSDKLNYGVFCLKAGVILFSGSIYILIALSFFEIPDFGIFILTPIGGTLLITGWSMFLIQVLNSKNGWRK